MVRNLSKYQFNYSFLFWFILLTLNFLFFFNLDASAATQVSLEWSPNSESTLAGYKVFSREQSQSYDYANPSWEGTNTYCTINNLDETKGYYFVARAFNTQGLESGNSEEVYLEPTPTPINQPPAANAGPDQVVDVGSTVTLSGSSSTDPDDGIATYQWIQTAGPNVTLSSISSKTVTFTAPDVSPKGASLAFELTVADHNGLESTDSCVVNVTVSNEPPQANAGIDKTVSEGDTVTLDGSSSIDIDNGISTYLWTQISGPAVTFSDPKKPNPTFMALNVGPQGASLTFKLTVTDSGGLQDTDTCIVNISWQNEPPTAVLVTDYIEAPAGTTVTLDGSKSTDPDDGIASYLWTQVDGTPINLSNPTSGKTTFTAPQAGANVTNLSFKLKVTDSGGLQSTANCIVYVIDATESGDSITIEAEDMPTKTTGGSTSDGWNIWSNGYISENMNFPSQGNYTFEIRAKGRSADGAWPKMEVRIDQTVVGSVTVDSPEWTTYMIKSDVSSGMHDVAVAFTNDYYQPPEDRNLYVDKVTIYFPVTSESSDSVNNEAEEVPTETTETTTETSEPNRWNFWSNRRSQRTSTRGRYHY
jgi:hypothetical protein